MAASYLVQEEDGTSRFLLETSGSFLTEESAPANQTAPVASGSTTVGSVVSTTNGAWADDGSPTFTYQWQRDVAGNAVYSNIGSATSSSYTLVTADNLCDVRCVVTDTDSHGATPANSNSILDTTATTAAARPDPLPVLYAAHVGQYGG